MAKNLSVKRMANLSLAFLSMFFISSCTFQNVAKTKNEKDVERILRILSADEMQGRANFTSGLNRAATFIETEFREIGLKSINADGNYRQKVLVKRINASHQRIIINGKIISDNAVMIITDRPHIDYNQTSGIKITTIKFDENLFRRYQEIIKLTEAVIVLVDAKHSKEFKTLLDRNRKERLIRSGDEYSNSAIFLLGIYNLDRFKIKVRNKIENLTLFNIVGVIPGKLKTNEIVIFSAHYDHLGVIKPRTFRDILKTWRLTKFETDSIANGADDNASGVTAVISLAKHYNKLKNNERTLLFVAFTAEEIGGFGSHYFSERLEPSSVIAMFNIEMVGKQSKYGNNSAFITGYDKSDLGEILQRNLKGTQFKFYPDPYPEQNLFYRSDNASLAALGIPAHTISTSKIDVDKFFHTVSDEVQTLDISNITRTIQAIALSSRSIISGTETPKRIQLQAPSN